MAQLPTLFDLSGKVAVVTGAAAGIGAACCRLLAEAGARVVVTDTDLAAASELAKELQPGGFALALDVAVPERVDAAFVHIAETCGGVDILVNNAAVMLRHVGMERAARPFTELEEEVWDQVMAVNVKGPWLCARAVFTDMQAQRWGRIINIASDTVFMGRGNGAQYITSKAAVIGFTRALACEVGRHGVTVNAISPGLTQSETVLEHGFDAMAKQLAEQSAIPRLEVPEDLAGTAAWIASDDAAFVTGQTICVSGGLVLH
jgi:NAD(P)-dependent dehydrogenase (short-subunit alcohol dehydrogenase family)